MLTLPEDARRKWLDVFRHAATADSAIPSNKWKKCASVLLASIGIPAFCERLEAWLPLVDRPRTKSVTPDWRWENHGDHHISDESQTVLRGLCWMAATIPRLTLARALGHLAMSAYRKVPGIGPRAVKLGNAAVYALGQMPGMDSIGQLAMLRVKVKFGTAQKGIDKALTAAAIRENLPREEIEELGVPTYGLTEVGKRIETLGDFTARLIVTGIGDTELQFISNAGAKAGKVQKSIPSALKASHPDDLKELKAAAKDIKAMLPAQRDRLDGMFLDNKTWAYSVSRERYLNHPLVGVLARRLIWQIADSKGGPWRSVTWLDEADSLVTIDGTPAAIQADSAIMRLWHPINVPTEETLAWRRFFEDRQIKQPFKQAHREVYLLTDAERNTNTYSNRFAAHVIRQHQFSALCGVRNWKNKLRLNVDAEYPPASRRVSAFNLRAEFWIEGAGEEINDAGAYLYLTTDQVRFYALDAAQVSAHAGGGGYSTRGDPMANTGLPLDSIPPLVLSECLRDVDLFVGVCSIGNNPEWSDGGPQGAFRAYWMNFSFGEISEAGKVRKDLLSRLVPRLAIAPACSFDDHFLVVKGTLRTYKIHLGSGNILMEPNDQYLCIVPSSRDESGAVTSPVFLPFEGDRTLSIILSKALMLAADDKIKDESITRQIKLPVRSPE